LCLVTGATGFVGSAVARALLAAGCDVRALARPNGDRRNLDGLPVAVAEGSLEDAASLVRAVAGCRHLFHVAADYRLWVPDPAAMFRANVTGTRALMHAALDAGVERIVYTSSVAVIGLVADGPAEETTPSRIDDMIGPYKRSKFAAEEIIRGLVAERRLPAVIVNPSTPIGPRDYKPTPTGRVILEAAKGRLPGFVDTGLNIAHVDDIATGHLLALQKGQIGERYILGGENVSLADMLADIAGLVGRRPPTLKLPRVIVYPFAYGAELMAKVRGVEPFITVDGLRMARHHMFFDDSKARRELGYVSRPYREGLSDAIAWFRSHGYLE
jgi:dihydroflavonol-4-reductase